MRSLVRFQVAPLPVLDAVHQPRESTRAASTAGRRARLRRESTYGRARRVSDEGSEPCAQLLGHARSPFGHGAGSPFGYRAGGASAPCVCSSPRARRRLPLRSRTARSRPSGGRRAPVRRSATGGTRWRVSRCLPKEPRRTRWSSTSTRPPRPRSSSCGAFAVPVSRTRRRPPTRPATSSRPRSRTG